MFLLYVPNKERIELSLLRERLSDKLSQELRLDGSSKKKRKIDDIEANKDTLSLPTPPYTILAPGLPREYSYW